MAKDSISALLDGECSPGELDRILDEMERSPELKASWSRLCLGRDAHEGVSVRKDQPCICAGVMSRLDTQEPAATSRVVPMTPPPRRRAWWMPAAGLAAAASLAAVAVVMNLQPQAGPTAAPGFVPQAVTPVSVPAKGSRPGLHVVSASQDDLQRSAQDDELRRYLIEHSNTLADRGMGATLSYARFTAHSVAEPSVLQPTSFGTAGDQP